MKTEIKIKKLGGSFAFYIPKIFCQHINLKEGESIIIQDDMGKHGPFIAFWKKQEKTLNQTLSDAHKSLLNILNKNELSEDGQVALAALTRIIRQQREDDKLNEKKNELRNGMKDGMATNTEQKN